MISGMASPEGRKAAAERHPDLTLTLAGAPYRATVSYTERGEVEGERRSVTFALPGQPAEQPSAVVRKQYVIPLQLLMVAGELLEDSLRKTATQPGEAVPAAASPETESASAVPQPRRQPKLTDRTTSARLGPVNTPRLSPCFACAGLVRPGGAPPRRRRCPRTAPRRR
jgi:hypothetical protein